MVWLLRIPRRARVPEQVPILTPPDGLALCVVGSRASYVSQDSPRDTKFVSLQVVVASVQWQVPPLISLLGENNPDTVTV